MTATLKIRDTFHNLAERSGGRHVDGAGAYSIFEIDAAGLASLRQGLSAWLGEADTAGERHSVKSAIARVDAKIAVLAARAV
jgi:hypothetical protein